MPLNMTDMNFDDLKYDGWKQAEKDITFVGGTANAIGDFDGTGDPFDIFAVTGTVKVKLVAICTTIMAGASATLEIGVTGKTAGLIALTTATNIDANEIWHDATPDSPLELSSVVTENILANSLNIIGNTKTANITSGIIKFICLWKPISIDGNVIAA